ncbi:MAG: hypothetical protein WCR72_15400 [Bacteroidota bacterium]
MKNLSAKQHLLVIGWLSLVILLITKNVAGQGEVRTYQPENNFKSRLFFGGGFGLQFGSVTLIELSPLVGYKLTPKLGIGVSPTYKYYRYKNYYSNATDLEANVFGGSIFARYMILENVFAHVEYESLYYNTKYPGYPTEMQQFNSFFVGGGYKQQIGGNASMYLEVLWNLNDTPDSPYTNPVIRMGFSVGL